MLPVGRRRNVVAWVLGPLFVVGVMSVGVTGCGERPQTEDVGPGVIFNSVMAGDVGGELKIIFPDYSREPAVEHPREESETFMIQIRPVWSPDGQKLAFTRTEEGMENALYVRTSLGHAEAESRRIGLAQGAPVWSPSSDRIAYLAMAKPGEVEGQEAKPQAEGEAPSKSDQAVRNDKTATEGEKAAQEPAKEGGGEGEKAVGLTIIGDDGSDSRLLVGGEAEPVGWSESDGIYHTRGIYGLRSLHVIDPATKKDRLVYQAGGGRFVGEAALAPVSDYLAFEVTSLEGNSILMIRNPRSGALTQVARGAGTADLAWSPNGTSVAFVRRSSTSGKGNIVVANARTKRIVIVAKTPAKYHSPTWSPDGASIGYVLDGEVYAMKIGARTARRVGKNEDVGVIAWSPK